MDHIVNIATNENNDYIDDKILVRIANLEKNDNITIESMDLLSDKKGDDDLISKRRDLLVKVYTEHKATIVANNKLKKIFGLK
jgi:hypothetical protein